MAYIAISHPERAPLMDNLTWNGGAVQTFVPPETYVYNRHGWAVMIQFPLQDSQTYRITAEYVTPRIGIPCRIEWAGAWKSGTITETSYYGDSIAVH